MPLDDYWMGKNIDVDRIWADYDQGDGYIAKVASAENYLLRLSFAGHPLELPLFDHEAVYKSVKSAFHDIKAECMAQDAYDAATPIFLYRVDRGSGIYEFLAELRGILPFVGALAAASMWYRSAMQKDQDLDEKRWKFIAAEFPRASAEDRAAYLKACTTWARRRVLQRLIKQGLYRVEISRLPLADQPDAKSATTVIIFEDPGGQSGHKEIE